MSEKKQRKKVEKKLNLSYRVVAFLQRPVPFFVSALFTNIMIIFVILVYSRVYFRISFASSSVLQVLSATVESSATILAIFLGVVTFMLGQPPSKLKRALGTGEFFSAVATFSLSIFFGITYMIITEPDERVPLEGVLIPAFLLMSSLILLSLFFFRLFRNRKQRYKKTKLV